ncbi:MAG TPA: cytochrome c [Burkholderiales bacterium]|nr:cytochrome c [Burkholderiales bacterium]
MRLLPLLLTMCATSAPADPFPQGAPDTGERLFDAARCNSCHVKIVGGDGSGIFTRPNSIIPDAAALLNRIRFCETQTGARWTAAEEIHVAAFLNRTYYHFP